MILADQNKVNQYYNEQLQTEDKDYFTWEGFGVIFETAKDKPWWKFFMGTLRHMCNVNSPTINPDTKNQNDININTIAPKVFPYLLYYYLNGDTITLEELVKTVVYCSLEE